AAPRRGAGVPRAARVERGVLRGADDGDGLRVAQRLGNDRSAHAVYEQSPPGGDHQRNHRSRLRSRGSLMATATAAAAKVGQIVQIIGTVVDVEFEGGYLPEIYNAVRIVSEAGDAEKVDVVSEVEQHLGENRVRTVAMKPTDGLRRGMRVIDTG